MKEKVEAALQKVRPMLQADGGDVELVDVQITQLLLGQGKEAVFAQAGSLVTLTCSLLHLLDADPDRYVQVSYTFPFLEFPLSDQTLPG